MGRFAIRRVYSSSVGHISKRGHLLWRLSIGGRSTEVRKLFWSLHRSAMIVYQLDQIWLNSGRFI